MQARYLSTLVATTAIAAALGLLATAASAAETEHDRHVFVNNANEPTPEAEAVYVGSANGGVWKTTNGLPAEPAAPSDVTTAPAEGRFDAYLELDGVPGESADDPHRDPPPQQAPAQTGQDVSSGQQQATIGLLVPAVQKVRSSASHAPADDGVVVLDTSLPQGGAAPRDPEMPICAHCSADVAEQPNAATEEERPQRRGGFSVSFGEITVGSGGVSVAAGDVNGDGRGESRRRSERRSDGRR